MNEWVVQNSTPDRAMIECSQGSPKRKLQIFSDGLTAFALAPAWPDPKIKQKEVKHDMPGEFLQVKVGKKTLGAPDVPPRFGLYLF